MTASTSQGEANVLLSVFAMTCKFVRGEELLAATQAWPLDQEKSLGTCLVQQGYLTQDQLAELQVMVNRHLAERPSPGNFQTMVNPAVPDAARPHDFATLVTPPEPAAAPQPLAVEETPAASPGNHFETLVQQPSRTGDGTPAGNLPPVHETLSVANPAGGVPGNVTHAAGSSSSATRFKIIRPHAKGGLGEVFVALDGEIRREVALKHIQDKYADDAECQHRFVSEAEITGSLEHPSIVPIYGLGTYPNGRPYYAMRFIRGSSFKKAIDRFHQQSVQGGTYTANRRELRQLLGQFVAVCNAIDYSHHRGVIHRDLKPANVMLGKYGETFVVDWGLAKMVDAKEEISTKPADDLPDDSEEGPISLSRSVDIEATRMGTQVGTPQFMSPEQAAGNVQEINFASDIYSLGATLYYLLTGQTPFSGKNVLNILQQVEAGDFPPPRERNRLIPKPLEAICLRAMSLRQEERHPSAGALAEEIECWLADEPVGSYRETLVERTMRWTRRHRAWTQAIVGSVFVVAVVATISTFLINRARESERKALGVAQQERAASEISFQKARRTVDKFFTSVSETQLLNVPGLQPLRQDLLREALSYYQGFVEERAADPKLRAELAATFYRIGLITNEIGSKAEAQKSLLRALKSQRELSQADPANQDAAFALANTLNAQGDSLLEEGKYAEALEFFQQAKQERERIAQAKPDDPQLQRKVLNSTFNIASAQALQGAKEAAITSYQESNESRRKLAQAHPQDPTYRLDLALGYFNLAHLQSEIGNIQAALATLAQAEAIYRQMVEQFPANIDYGERLTKVLRLMAEAQIKQGQLELAQPTIEQAHQMAKHLASANPLVAQLQHELVLVDYQRSDLEYKLDNPAESLSAADEALALLRNLVRGDESVSQYKIDLASLQKLRGKLNKQEGRIEEACAALEEGLQLYSSPPLQDLPGSELTRAEFRLLLATALLEQPDVERALPLLEENKVRLEELIQTSPLAIEPPIFLARTQLQIGSAQGETQNVNTGLATLQQTTAGLEELLDRFPDNRVIFEELSNAHARSFNLVYGVMNQLIDESAKAPEAEQPPLQEKVRLWEGRVLHEIGELVRWRARIGTRDDANADDYLAWGHALHSQAYVEFDLRKIDDAIRHSQEAASMIDQAVKKFPGHPKLTYFRSELGLQMIEFRQAQSNFAELQRTAHELIGNCQDSQMLVNLATRIAGAAVAAEMSDETKMQVAPLRQLAVQACQQAVELDSAILQELPNIPELATLQGIPEWEVLLQSDKQKD